MLHAWTRFTQDSILQDNTALHIAYKKSNLSVAGLISSVWEEKGIDLKESKNKVSLQETGLILGKRGGGWRVLPAVLLGFIVPPRPLCLLEFAELHIGCQTQNVNS